MTTARLILTTVLCLGLNLLIRRLKQYPKLAMLVTGLIVANEIRGALIFWQGAKLIWN